MRILFVTVGFVYSRQRSTITDGKCRQEHLTRYFSHALCTSDCVHTHCMAQDEPRLKSVSVRASIHPHVIYDVCLSVRCLSLRVCLVCSHHNVAQGVSVRVSFHLHAIHDVMCLSVRWSFLVSHSLLFLSVFYLLSSTLYQFSARHTIFNAVTAEG